jgi:SM-20-related protein
VNFVRLNGFLDTGLIRALLEYVRANERHFEASVVRDATQVVHDPSTRVSLRLADLGHLRPDLERRFLAMLPGLIEQLRVSTFVPSGLELEVTAHGDGAFYLPHVDVMTGTGRDRLADRLVSAVCYFHDEPKGFDGGGLRLHPLPEVVDRAAAGATTVQPEQGSAVAFSSWTPHEVLPVSCPSGRFMDSRFAINCWYLRARKRAPAASDAPDLAP